MYTYIPTHTSLVPRPVHPPRCRSRTHPSFMPMLQQGIQIMRCSPYAKWPSPECLPMPRCLRRDMARNEGLPHLQHLRATLSIAIGGGTVVSIANESLYYMCRLSTRPSMPVHGQSRARPSAFKRSLASLLAHCKVDTVLQNRTVVR